MSVSKCPACGLSLADPPTGGKCDPRSTAAAPAPKPATEHTTEGDIWSRGEYVPGWHASQPHGPVR